MEKDMAEYRYIWRLGVALGCIDPNKKIYLLMPVL